MNENTLFYGEPKFRETCYDGRTCRNAGTVEDLLARAEAAESTASRWQSIAAGLAEGAREVIKEADVGGNEICWYLWDELKPLRVALAAYDAAAAEREAE